MFLRHNPLTYCMKSNYHSEQYEDFYLFMDSSDSVKTRPDNSFNHFTVDLPQTTILSASSDKKWTMAITDFALTNVNGLGENLPQSIIIMCPLAKQSYIKNCFRPVLRTIHSATEREGVSLFIPYYLPTTQSSFNNIEFYLTDKDLGPLDLALWPTPLHLVLTLHFMIQED